jgi:acetyltransferase-like isoleucine patch superfamily enzyme
MSSAAGITIGDDVGMSGASVCAAVSVSIGHRVMLGSGAIVADTDFHATGVAERRYLPASEASSAAVTIEDDVFLGANSIVLKGVTIGHGSVIGAGSVVSRDIPPGVVAAGNPCRPLHQVYSGEGA